MIKRSRNTASIGAAARICAPLIVAVAGATAVAEQPRSSGTCVPERAPFALTAANQLKAAALSERIAGKTLVAERKGSGNSEGRIIRYRVQFRGDGSVEMRCESRPAEAGRGSWRGCRQFNPGSAGAPDRDLGTWRIEGDELVLQRIRSAAEGREEGRFTVHAEGGSVAVRRRGGSTFCLPGTVRFE